MNEDTTESGCQPKTYTFDYKVYHAIEGFIARKYQQTIIERITCDEYNIVVSKDDESVVFTVLQYKRKPDGKNFGDIAITRKQMEDAAIEWLAHRNKDSLPSNYQVIFNAAEAIVINPQQLFIKYTINVFDDERIQVVKFDDFQLGRKHCNFEPKEPDE